jgi:hypothetical protein
VSTYYAGAKALGHDVAGVIYDVISKPTLRPLKATPVESRKYTKAGTLYAAQRAEDEVPEQYALRLVEAIAANPDRYYQRGTVVRLDHEETAAALDLSEICRQITAARAFSLRNPDACLRFGRPCDYFNVCCGTASLDDETRFKRVSNVHQELDL